jgi:hypothetical protein
MRRNNSEFFRGYASAVGHEADFLHEKSYDVDTAAKKSKGGEQP